MATDLQTLKGKFPPPLVRRSRTERQLSILRVVAEYGPILRTHILYKSNVTWEELTTTLEGMTSIGLIRQEHTEDGVLFTVAEAGRLVISHYQFVEENLDATKAKTLNRQVW